MTDQSGGLLALAERCEKVDGPDRELDLAIWRLSDPRAVEVEAAGRKPLPWLYCYTASLDAAMTLVPEDECWRVGHDADDPSGFMAQCSYTPGLGKMGFVTGSGINAALALTAAALRARAAITLATGAAS